MNNQDEQSIKENKRKKKRIAEEAKQLARAEARKDTLAREQAIEKDQKEREIKRAERRVAEEAKQLARTEARRKDTLAREQAIENRRKVKK